MTPDRTQENMDQRGATIDDFRVSKKEEAEALAYIKKHIVNEAVEYFEVNKASYGRRKNDVVDAKKIIPNLRKSAHFKAGEPGNPNDEADYIVYEGYDSTEDFWPPTTFKFIITKDHNENGWIYLAAGYINPLKRGHSIIMQVKRTKHYPPKPIKEGRSHRRQPIESIALLSKREKDEAFYHLKMIVVPKAVNNVNAYLMGTKGMEAGTVTAQEVLKNLKKISDDGNKVVYQAKLPGIDPIRFLIEKKNTHFVLNQYGKAMVFIGFWSPRTEYPHQFVVHPDTKWLIEANEHLPFSQRPESPPKQVTKQEEMMMLNLLKQHYVKEFPEIGKYLKKTRVHPSPNPEVTSDKIQYEYNDGKKRALFALCRTGAGLWILMWEWGDNRARDHLHVNVLGQSKLVKEVFEGTVVDVKDNGMLFETENPMFTRREESYALDVIKKRLLPKDLADFNGITDIKHWYQRKYPGAEELQFLTLEQAQKLIHKTLQGKEHNNAFAMYVVRGPQHQWPSMQYFISKNFNGTISIYYDELIQRKFEETIITP